MSNYASITAIYGQWDRGSHQLVSEQGLAAVAEGSHEGSSNHGGSGGTTAGGGGSHDYDGRITSLETTMGIWSGTILNLSGKVDQLLDLSGKVDRVLDLSDRFDRMEKLFEEMINSKKNGEYMNQNPSLHYPIAVQNCFPHIHMSTSPLHANVSHPWSVNPPVMTPVVSVSEQTPEERIRLLRAICQKYKGDSKSPEEQLQILTAVAQKYKENKDSKLFEKQLPDEVSLLQPVVHMEPDYIYIENFEELQSDQPLDEVGEERQKTDALTELKGYSDPGKLKNSSMGSCMSKDSGLNGLTEGEQNGKANTLFPETGVISEWKEPVKEPIHEFYGTDLHYIVDQDLRTNDQQVTVSIFKPLFNCGGLGKLDQKLMIWDPGIKLHASSFNFKL